MQFIGEISALTAALFWGFCAILFESAGKQIGAFATNLLRIVFAVVLLCITLYLKSGFFFPAHATLEEILWLGSSGIVGLAIGDGALFVCLVILDPRLATLLLSLAPTFTVVLAWMFLDEKLGALALFGVSITILGIFWVVSEKHGKDQVRGTKTKGVILGIIAALGQGLGLVLAKQGLQGDLDTLSATILRMVPAALALWIYALFSGHILSTLKAVAHKKALAATIGGTIFGPFLGVWLANIAVKNTQTGIASTLLATVPILIIPMVIIIHKTKPSLRAIIGTVIAFIGIAAIFLR
jgi:uncharacterized membrane protein